jgi:lipopolysaccharide biosynthesis glycosyltransferase
MIKFALPNLFPELNKILYLDSDILVEKDLSELYKTNLDGIYVAAVADMAGMVEESLHLRLGLEKYLNSGMMLLNLEKMREENISDKLLDAKLNDKIKQFMDQDAFNQVFAGNVKWLSSTFNLMKPNLECYSLEEIAKFYEHTISKMEEIMKTPHINHLTNILKPWKTSEATEFEHWYFYFQQLPESKTKTFARIKLCSNKYILKTEKLKKFIQQIFSISNRENYKCIFILGIKIKIKRQS